MYIIIPAEHTKNETGAGSLISFFANSGQTNKKLLKNADAN